MAFLAADLQDEYSGLWDAGPKLNLASAVTVEWWLLLPEHHLASLQQKDGSMVCTWVSACGFAGIVCAGGWAAGAVMGTLCYRWKAFPCAGTGEEEAAGLLRRLWKSVLVLFSSLLSQSLAYVAMYHSPGRCGLLSGGQDKSLGCSICVLIDRCEDLLNSKMLIKSIL